MVLERILREVIRIGGEIKVGIISAEGGSVKLGMKAPGEVPVHRAEAHQKLDAEGKQGSHRAWKKNA